jgi:two-component system OmpR family sensor kinase
MFNSVRVRLTVYYAVVFTFILLLIAAGTYTLLRRETAQRIDSDITELANSFVATVQAELRDESRTESISDAANEAIVEHTFREYVFAVFDTNGTLVRASSDPDPEDRRRRIHPTAVFRTPEFHSFLAGSSAKPTFEYLRGEGRYRAYSQKISTPQGDYTVVALFSLHASEEFLESIRHTLAVVIPLGILLASIGGYLLARSALAPVVTMSHQASKIDAKQIGDRLVVANPRDELGVLAQSFNGLLDRLSESIEQQRRFMADASHELRTPVAILRGETDVALSKEDRPDAEYRESLGVLRDAARGLGQIVEDLFTLARADAGTYPIVKSRFYLDELLAECIRSTRSLAGAKNIRTDLASEPDLLIEADEGLIRRLFLNLIDNAIKFTPDGGRVSVKVRKDDHAYLISVADSGAGIPEALQGRVFERFFRADQSRTHSDDVVTGAGLGLAISRWVAEVHGGTLNLSSSSSEGSIFVVSLRAETALPSVALRR